MEKKEIKIFRAGRESLEEAVRLVQSTEEKMKEKSWIEENTIWIEVADQGVGIGDVNRAMEPLFTTRPEMERSGMGFAFMEAFMDELHVESQVGQGTTIRMKKKIYSSFILS